MTKRISRNIAGLMFITMLLVNVITPLQSFASISTNNKVTINNPRSYLGVGNMSNEGEELPIVEGNFSSNELILTLTKGEGYLTVTINYGGEQRLGATHSSGGTYRSCFYYTPEVVYFIGPQLQNIASINKGTTVIDIKEPGDYYIRTQMTCSVGYQHSRGVGFSVTEEMVNNKPTITSTNTPQTVGVNKAITLTGTVQDPDNDTLTVSATINGKTKNQTVTNTSTEKPYTLTWNSSEVDNGNYTNLSITVDDGIDTSTVNYTGTISVDKIKPKLNIIITK